MNLGPRFWGLQLFPAQIRWNSVASLAESSYFCFSELIFLFFVHSFLYKNLRKPLGIIKKNGFKQMIIWSISNMFLLYILFEASSTIDDINFRVQGFLKALINRNFRTFSVDFSLTNLFPTSERSFCTTPHSSNSKNFYIICICLVLVQNTNMYISIYMGIFIPNNTCISGGK